MKLRSPTVADRAAQLNFEQIAAILHQGLGGPEGVVVANVGSLYLRRDGGASTTLYAKEADDGAATGWVAK